MLGSGPYLIAWMHGTICSAPLKGGEALRGASLLSLFLIIVAVPSFCAVHPKATYDVSKNVLKVEMPSESFYTIFLDGVIAGRGFGRVASVVGIGGSTFFHLEKIEVECEEGNRFEIRKEDVEIKRFKYAPQSGTLYKLFIRSFFDSDGDGVGDLRGVVDKVGYLKTLADVVWLLPFNPVGSYHGYDPIDFYSVDPAYGTLEDLENLIEAFNDSGIAVVMDLVINHTSWEHPWFKDAVENLESSPYWSYYILSREKPSVARGRWYAVTNSKGEEVWYFALFDRTMPDLNFDSPSVRSEVRRIVDYWLTVGVNGFRIDAVKNFYGWEWSDAIIPSASYSRELYSYILEKDPNAIVVGEAYDGSTYVLSKFAPLPVFNFRFMFELTSNYLGRDDMLAQAVGWLARGAYISDFFHFPFLDNHDRNRLISVLISAFGENKFGATKQYLLLNAILLTMPGVPAIYYGNELAQRGVRFPNEPWDMGIREPMQWYAAGEGPGQTSWTSAHYRGLGVATSASAFDEAWDGVSVEEQEPSPLSVLSFFKDLVNLRREFPVLIFGDVEILSDVRTLYAYRIWWL